MTRRTDLAVLQSLLAAQHAVVYGYGVAGAHLRGPARARATRGWTAHRAARDRLADMVRERGGTPEPPAAAYALPAAVETARDARTLVTLLEERLAAVWADAVADLDGHLRAFAARGLTDAAVAAAGWRGGSVPFPGLPERSSSPG